MTAIVFPRTRCLRCSAPLSWSGQWHDCKPDFRPWPPPETGRKAQP